MKANAQFPEEQSDGGEFQRQEDAFRAWVTDDAGSPHPVARGRYHLYVSPATVAPAASLMKSLRCMDDEGDFSSLARILRACMILVPQTS